MRQAEFEAKVGERLKQQSPPTNRAASAEEKPKQKRESQADLMVKMVEESGCELFHTPLDESFITFPANNHLEHWPIRSKSTRQWLTRLFYAATKKAPNSEALQAALNLLEAKARFDGKKTDVNLRTAWSGDALYYDFCDEAWRAVKIAKDGWQIIENPPVKFQRFRHMAAQVEPESGGDLDGLFDFVNVKNVDERKLVKSFAVVGLVPDIPRPCLVLHGDQGSGKSTMARRLRGLIDPSGMPLLKGKDETEIVQGLAHHYCAVFDNLSGVPEWLSDILSRAVTGEGFTKRMLYTDADDVLFAYRRLLILTGIGLVVTKPDLLDRSLIVAVERISEDRRREEKSLDAEFEAARPRLFGATLDLLVGALRTYDSVIGRNLPRMADFARWSLAVEAGQGKAAGEWQEAYNLNVNRQNEEALSASVVAQALMVFMAGKGDWSGQPNELYVALKGEAEHMKVAAKQWPGNASILGRRLREIRPNLEAVGLRIVFGASDGRKITTIARLNEKNDDTGGNGDIASPNGSDASDATSAENAIFPISSASERWEEI